MPLEPKNQESRRKARYSNNERDEATLGTSQELKPKTKGLANEDTPPWSPPESVPEPRPTEPVLKSKPSTVRGGHDSQPPA